MTDNVQPGAPSDWKLGPHLPIGLGGSVFGWLVDAHESDRILDQFFELGGRVIDTSDGYSHAARETGGDSESILGSWIRRRGVESDVRIITKVGLCPGVEGLSAMNVARAVTQSQHRLGMETLEAVLAHADDDVTPPEEIAAGLGALIGTHARHIGVSRFRPSRLHAVIAAARGSLPSITVVQEEFSLAHRGTIEALLTGGVPAPMPGLICSAGLAQGFLTGKFRDITQRVGHRQAFVNNRYNRPEHRQLLDHLRAIATGHQVSPATVALRWLIEHPAVALPLASVTLPEQLNDFARVRAFEMSSQEWADLDALSHAANGK